MGKKFLLALLGGLFVLTNVFAQCSKPFAGEDTMYCYSYNPIRLTGTSDRYAEWKTKGTGRIVDSTQLTTYYYPSAEDLEQDSLLIRLVALAHDGCPEVSDSVYIKFGLVARNFSYDNYRICPGGTQLNLPSRYTSRNRNVVYEWYKDDVKIGDQDSLKFYFVPTANEKESGGLVIKSVTSVGACISYDTLYLRVDSLKSVYVGEDVYLNIAQAPVQLHGAPSLYDPLNVPFQWGTSGTGMFSNPASTYNSYIPSAADVNTGTVQIFFSATDKICNVTKRDTMVISISSETVHFVSGKVLNAPANNHWISVVIYKALPDGRYSYITSTSVSAGSPNYTFSVEDGIYIIQAPSAVSPYQTTYYGGATGWIQATRVIVDGADHDGYNITLITNENSDQTWNTGQLEIKGYVQINEVDTRTADAGTLAGIVVTLYNSSKQILTQTQTNAAGEYSFTNLIAGTYYVSFDQPGIAAQDLQEVAVADDGSSAVTVNSVLNHTSTATSVNDGIKKAEEVFTSYPNPVSDILYIAVTGGDLEELSVTDLLGNIVFKTESIQNGSKTQLLLSHLNGGVYILCAKSASLVYKYKFVKE